jgi:hypothetical protein
MGICAGEGELGLEPSHGLRRTDQPATKVCAACLTDFISAAAAGDGLRPRRTTKPSSRSMRSHGATGFAGISWTAASAREWTEGHRRSVLRYRLRQGHQWRRDLRRLPADQRSRSLGSRASRSASPNRLKPKTVSAIARPGKTAIHGAVEAYSSAPPCNIRPHAAVGSCTPSPR